MKKYSLCIALLLVLCGTCLAADNPATVEFKFITGDKSAVAGAVSWMWQNPEGQATKYITDANGSMLIVFSEAGVYHADAKLTINGEIYTLKNNEFSETDMNRSMGKNFLYFLTLSIDEAAKTATIKDISGINKHEALPKYVNRLSAPGKLEIVRVPAIDEYLLERKPVDSVAPYQSDGNPFQWDFRSCDVTKLDFDKYGTDIFHSMFDTKTIWPAKLPFWFEPKLLIKTGKNPGLGLRALHREGYIGSNVGIAIIDNNVLLTGHQEYAAHLRLYEEIHVRGERGAAMHAPAVSSAAVGKTVGVAPGADLYYIAVDASAFTADNGWQNDFSCFGEAIDRVLEINKILPPNRKIRVISISWGWSPNQPGYEQAEAALQRAKKAGVFVITSAAKRNYPNLKLMGLGCEPYSDADKLSSYTPGSWWKDSFFKAPQKYENFLLVPMDQRTLASSAGDKEYMYNGDGGLSWSIPWLAGMYALCCQVKPSITPDEFVDKALATGDTITVEENGKTYQLSKVINPQKLIEALRK